MPVTNCTQHVLLRASFVAAAARLPICLRKGEDSPSTPAATPPLTRTRSTNGWLRVCSNADARDRKSPTGDGVGLGNFKWNTHVPSAASAPTSELAL